MKNSTFLCLALLSLSFAISQSEHQTTYASLEQEESSDKDNWRAFYFQVSPLGFTDMSIFRPTVPVDDVVNFRDNVGAGYAYELNAGFYVNSFFGIGFSYSNSSFSDSFDRFGELFYKNELNINSYSINVNNLVKGFRDQDLFYFSYGVTYFDMQQEFATLFQNYERRASGNGFGLRTEIGYQYHLTDQLFLNLSSNFILGSLTSVRSYTPENSYRLNELEEDQTSLMQINFLVGLTYYLPFQAN